jgi:N-acyl-L-homoserine lactone synthetase
MARMTSATRAPRLLYSYAARPLAAADGATLDAAWRLRDAVFARELGWVPPGAGGRERDRCDQVARHFGAFARPRAAEDAAPRLVGYARVLLPEQGFMLQREFAAILDGRPLHVDARRAFEVSRFVVHPRHRGVLDARRHGVGEHLARAIALWALTSGRTEWLCVCEVRHVRALRLRGLPFTHFGTTVEYQPGVPVCAALLDLPRAAARLRARRPADYAWYTEEEVPSCLRP